MSASQDGLNFVMLREDLADVPPHPLPEGYRLRLYRRGDSRTWARIWADELAAGAGRSFRRELGGDLAAMGRRCLFLVSPDGAEIGTATAWYARYQRRRWGRLHWVAILPACRGRGLSRCLVGAALRLMRTLGHRRAMLATQTWRIAAIRTYLRFGFVLDPNDRAIGRVRELLRPHIRLPSVSPRARPTSRRPA